MNNEEKEYYECCFNLKKFEESCQAYAKEKSMKKQSAFLKRCRYSMVGICGKRKWMGKEREMKLDLLEKYFPGSRQAMLEYEKQELESLASRERIRQDRDKQKLLNERLR